MSLQALNAAIYTRLNGATTAGANVFFLQAPDSQALPYVVFDYTADLDENLSNNRTRNGLVYIRAYGVSQAVAGGISEVIDGLMHNKVLTVTGWDNFWCMREDGFPLVETDESGRKTYAVGSEYRIRLDKS